MIEQLTFSTIDQFTSGAPLAFLGYLIIRDLLRLTGTIFGLLIAVSGTTGKERVEAVHAYRNGMPPPEESPRLHRKPNSAVVTRAKKRPNSLLKTE